MADGGGGRRQGDEWQWQVVGRRWLAAVGDGKTAAGGGGRWEGDGGDGLLAGLGPPRKQRSVRRSRAWQNESIDQ